jgi:uncharacterized membrane protein
MSNMKSESRANGLLEWLVLTLALLGFSINLFLLFRRFSDPTSMIAGCGGGSCAEVLGSRWSSVFGIPVTAFGLMVYAGLMIAMVPRFERGFALFAGMILGAAVWFVFVQFVLIGKICPWCMTAHGVGVLIVILGWLRFGRLGDMALWSFFALLGISLSQLYGPVPASHRLDDLSGISAPSTPPSKTHGRMTSFDDGRKSYDIASLPLLGSADAKWVMVEYFDYQCEACQVMSGYLEALIAKHPAGVACILLPMPLDGACNADAPAGNQHPGSCEIARTALGVWRGNPAAFPQFHRELLANPGLDNAKRLAAAIISEERKATEMSDPWTDSLLQANIADWRALSQSTPKLPKLLIRGKRILHGLPSGREDFIRVMEKELGL